jgi:hypothetical protein
MSPEKESCVIQDGLRDVELPRHFCADREEIPRKSGLLCVSGEIAAEEWRDFLSGFEESLKDAGEEGEEANFRR